MKLTKNKEIGFTFLELVLVLSIVFIMTAIIIPVGEKWIQTTSEEDAIKSLVVTINSLQSYSIANKVYTRLSFRKPESQTMYVAAAPGKEEFSRKMLPEGMHLSNSSQLKTVEFHANGDIINFGTLTLVTNSGRITITFQFQRGRMIISESKRLFLAGSNPHPYRHSPHFWYTSSARNENDFYITQQEIGHVRS